MADQRLRISANIDFPNAVPAGIVGDDIEWLSFHNASTPASGTALWKFDITDVTNLVLGNTIRLTADMVFLDYPNDSSDNETEALGQSLFANLLANGFYCVAHDGDPGTEAQFFGQNQITEVGVATIAAGNLEVVDKP